MLLVHAVQSSAQFRHSMIATEDQGTARNWAETADRVARIADGLRAIGIRPGDRIGLLSLNSAAFLEAQLAIWWMGGVLVAMNYRWSLEEHLYSVDDAGLTLLFHDAEHREIAVQIAGQRPVAIVTLDGERIPEEASIAAMIATRDAGPAHDGPNDALAGIYYTGGTTGFPKGVMLSHMALWAAAVGISGIVGMTEQSILLHAAPMFHLGDGALSHAALIAGAKHVFIRRFDPEQAMQVIEQTAVTITLLPPTMLAMVQQHRDYRPSRLASMRSLLFGASPMSPALLANIRADLPSLSLIHAYGQTEMGPSISSLDPAHQLPNGPKAMSIGRPMPGVQVRIVDSDGRDAVGGAPGEILARSPAMMSGYWNKPDETAHTIVNGWIHTGDVAYRDCDGFMFICDRVKDMIITGGENVFSAEVENAVEAHPAVAQVAVIGIPDPDYGERVHAVIVVRPQQSITIEELIAHCRVRIANYKCPRSMEVRESLPLSATGKVLKRDLRAPHWIGQDRGIA